MDIELLELYMDKFDDTFPSMCFRCATDEELNDKMKQCIEQNKKAEELFNLDFSEEIYY
ncbi:MAG: hypothetical protein ACRCR2_03685 [Fusobacteriaceae bacterium]